MVNKVTVNQRTAAPSRKQNFNLAGSQMTTVALVVFAIAAPELYARIPPDMLAAFGSALGGAIGFGLGYLVAERA